VPQTAQSTGLSRPRQCPQRQAVSPPPVTNAPGHQRTLPGSRARMAKVSDVSRQPGGCGLRYIFISWSSGSQTAPVARSCRITGNRGGPGPRLPCRWHETGDSRCRPITRSYLETSARTGVSASRIVPVDYPQVASGQRLTYNGTAPKPRTEHNPPSLPSGATTVAT
jgi:hypothetical protein